MTVPLRVPFQADFSPSPQHKNCFRFAADCTFFQLELMKPADRVPPIELKESPDRRAGALTLGLIKQINSNGSPAPSEVPTASGPIAAHNIHPNRNRKRKPDRRR